MRSRTRDPSFRRRLAGLKTRMIDLEAQMANARRRLDRVAGRPPAQQRPVRRCAVVDLARCTGCGICWEVCPQDAVSPGRVPVIDPQRCTGCGTCLRQCPRGAIRLADLAEETSF